MNRMTDGRSSRRRSSAGDDRAKQAAARIRNGVVGSTGTAIPTMPSTVATTPAASQSQRMRVERITAFAREAGNVGASEATCARYHHVMQPTISPDLKPRRAIFTHLTHETGHAELAAKLPRGVEPGYDGLTVEIG